MALPVRAIGSIEGMAADGDGCDPRERAEAVASPKPVWTRTVPTSAATVATDSNKRILRITSSSLDPYSDGLADKNPALCASICCIDCY